MARRKAVYAVLAGSLAALLTLVWIKYPARLPASVGTVAWLGVLVTFLLFPGFVVGFMISGNIHAAYTWVVVAGNFLIYFGLVYFAVTLWEIQRARPRGGGAAPPEPK